MIAPSGLVANLMKNMRLRLSSRFAEGPLTNNQFVPTILSTGEYVVLHRGGARVLRVSMV
jgi:hypothetical protein